MISGQSQGTQRIGVAQPLVDLGAVLASHRGPDLSPIVDALEAAGFGVHLAIAGVLVGERRPPMRGARIDVHRITVEGDLQDEDGWPERWVIARGSVNEPWYGRPHRPGHHPWGFGPAPTGDALVAFLRGLIVDDVETVGGAR
jgi:hypothetical protein